MDLTESVIPRGDEAPALTPTLQASTFGTLTLYLGRRAPGAPPMEFEVVPPTIEALESFTRRARELGADPTGPLVTVCVGLELVALAVTVPADLRDGGES